VGFVYEDFLFLTISFYSRSPSTFWWIFILWL